MNVTSVPYLDSGGYSESLSIHIWLKADGTQSSHAICKQPSANVNNGSIFGFFPLPDLDKSPTIEISAEHQFKVMIYPSTKKIKKVRL